MLFGTLAFGVNEHVDMPRPGEIRAARLAVELTDRIWGRLYQPIVDAVGFIGERLNQLQFLTIRRYLSLVFVVLVVLLLALAIWP